MVTVKKKIISLATIALLLCSAFFIPSAGNVKVKADDNSNDSWEDWGGTGGTTGGTGQVRADYTDGKLVVTTNLETDSTSGQRIRSIGWLAVIHTNDGRTSSAVFEYPGDKADYEHVGALYSGYMFSIDYVVNEFMLDGGKTGEAVAKQFFYGTGKGGGGTLDLYAYFTKWIKGRYDGGYEIGGYIDNAPGSVSGKFAGDPVNDPNAPINYSPSNVRFDINSDYAFGGIGVSSTQGESERIPASWGGGLDLHEYYPAEGCLPPSKVANNDLTVSIVDMGQFRTNTDVIQSVLVTNTGLPDITPADDVKVSFTAKQIVDNDPRNYQSETQMYTSEPAASKTYSDGGYTGTVYWHGTKSSQTGNEQVWNSKKYHDTERTDKYYLSPSQSHNPPVIDHPNTYRNSYLGDDKTQWQCLGFASYTWNYETYTYKDKDGKEKTGTRQVYKDEYYTFPDGTRALIPTSGEYVMDEVWTYDGYMGGYDTVNKEHDIWTGFYSGTLYSNDTTTVTDQTKRVICPAQASQIVYFKYHTSKTPGNVTETATVNGNSEILETDSGNNTASKTISVIRLKENTPPDPKGPDRPDYYFEYLDPQNLGAVTSRTWGLYEWIDNDFKYVTYSATASSALAVTPDSYCPTAIKDGGSYTMKSGYGIDEDVKTSVRTSSADPDAITGVQRTIGYYPEFEYDRADIDAPNSGYFRLFDRMASGLNADYQLAKNMCSMFKKRAHFIPIWFHDGTYTAETYCIDAWTPSGMLSTQSTGSVKIKGCVFDDFHVFPKY